MSAFQQLGERIRFLSKTTELKETLKKEFSDPEYRYAYAEDFLNTFVATQIKAIREQRGMTQQDLAEAIGTQQAGISRLENVNYSAWKTETLRKIAHALGVRLKITFEPFGTLLDEASRFSREALERPDFEHDPAFQPFTVITDASEAFGLLTAALLEQSRKQQAETAPFTFVTTENPAASQTELFAQFAKSRAKMIAAEGVVTGQEEANQAGLVSSILTSNQKAA